MSRDNIISKAELEADPNWPVLQSRPIPVPPDHPDNIAKMSSRAADVLFGQAPDETDSPLFYEKLVAADFGRFAQLGIAPPMDRVTRIADLRAEVEAEFAVVDTDIAASVELVQAGIAGIADKIPFTAPEIPCDPWPDMTIASVAELMAGLLDKAGLL